MSLMRALLTVLCSGSILCGYSAAQMPRVPNGSFEEGSGQAPDGWTLSGSGEWGAGGGFEGKRFVTIRSGGQEQENAYWNSAPIPFAPNTIYEMRVRYRYRPEVLFKPATMVLGTSFATRDVTLTSQDAKPKWETFTMRFVTPILIAGGGGSFRLGQWKLAGAIDFDGLELYPVLSADREIAGLELGMGERIEGDRYTFLAPLGEQGGIARPLHSFKGKLHHNRWRFHEEGDFVVYRHELAARVFQKAKLSLSPQFHAETTWRLVVEASADGVVWREIGVVEKSGDKPPQCQMELPAALFPAKSIFVRLRSDTSRGEKPVFFQVTAYEFSAVLDGKSAPAVGGTSFLTVLDRDEGITLRATAAAPGTAAFTAIHVNTGKAPVEIAPQLTVRHELSGEKSYPGKRVTLAPEKPWTGTVAFESGKAGHYALLYTLGKGMKTRIAADFTVPIIAVDDYGETLPSPDPSVGLWWASSGWKVGRTRGLPAAKGFALKIKLARNESEAVQLVVRPQKELSDLSVDCGAMRAPSASFSASNIEILRVRYVRVDKASDAIGSTGDWPDPLPPQRPGLNAPAGENQPFWIRVKAPKDAEAGTYKGELTLRAGPWRATVPLEIEVYGFSLPDRMTCESAFGFDSRNVYRYHKATTEADKRLLIDKYFTSFASHHIAPYNPAPLDPFTVDWPKVTSAWEGGKIVPEAKFGKNAFFLEDPSDTANATARHLPMMTLPGNPLQFSVWYKTRDDADSAAYLGFFTEDDKFISGKNREIKLPRGAEWKQLQAPLDTFPAGAKKIRLWFHAVPYAEKGGGKGAVWLDSISLKDRSTGVELLTGGDFEAGPERSNPTIRFDWQVWDNALERALDIYHFNTFLFPIPGLGSGTFHARIEPSLLGFSEETPEYRALLAAWCRGAREHLVSKNWLPSAYIYPFDEPAEKDYPFVLNQTKKIKENFPGLRRMVPLNLGTADSLIGAFDTWCPILNSHNAAFKKAREAEGARFWWYICTGPRAPFVASFIDRPATDLRVWLWQTWEEQIDGILIWQTSYWHSGTAYPDSLQNPYEDSMSWVSGYSVPKGVKQPWAAGDGRFFYPPEAATGAQKETVMDGPVDSIRWEMLRDGIEDYEYFAMLKRLLAQKGARLSPADREGFEALLKVPPSISQSITRYTSDPAPLEARRDELARALARLSATK